MSWLVWVSPHLHSWKGQSELFIFCSVLLREIYLLKRLMRWLKWDVNKYYLLMGCVLGNSLTIDCKAEVFEVVFLLWVLILTINENVNCEFLGILTLKAPCGFSYTCSMYSLYLKNFCFELTLDSQKICQDSIEGIVALYYIFLTKLPQCSHHFRRGLIVYFVKHLFL